MSARDELREALAEALCDWWNDDDHPTPDGGCDACRREADTLLPLIEAHREADAWDEGHDLLCAGFRCGHTNPYRQSR